jgi:hypothetical protein
LNNKPRQISEGKMTNQTTENFLQAWSEFQWPDLVTPSYRLYYNDDGSPKCYSTDPMSDKYIEVDADTFAQRPWNVRIVDGKLIFVEPPVQVQKLLPSNKSGITCHPKDVCIVVSKNQSHTKWNRTINEIS